MACLIPVAGVEPQCPAFLAPNATLVGDVRFGPQCSVWFGAVLRGDINHVEVGEGSNIQDLCCVHVSQARPCRIGAWVSLGHAAIAHACDIGDQTLLGMGCKVLDGAVVGRRCLVAAGCVVPEGMVVPDGHLVAGLPGKILKPLSADQQERVVSIATRYVDYQRLYPDLVSEALRS
jgi:carbonic anhydrase/acetyltransferase-like protein (isoleucine patch superfamily)